MADTKAPVTVYLHSDKETMYYYGLEDLGLKGPALEAFKYCLYEVAVDLMVDPVTGEYEIVSFEPRHGAKYTLNKGWNDEV